MIPTILQIDSANTKKLSKCIAACALSESPVAEKIWRQGDECDMAQNHNSIHTMDFSRNFADGAEFG